MIFHNQEFHETKRERKYYEGKKIKLNGFCLCLESENRQ